MAKGCFKDFMLLGRTPQGLLQDTQIKGAVE
jgi:hypothetical protein